jgi:hypothetical protein
VVTLPAAPLWAAKGQPPRPATALSKRSTPISSAATTLAIASARVSWRWSFTGISGQRARTVPTSRLIWSGLAQPMVSARLMLPSREPHPTACASTLSMTPITWAGVTSPS